MGAPDAARISRRRLLGSAAGGAAAVALGATFLPDLLDGGSHGSGAPRTPTLVSGTPKGAGYGPLGKPDANGISLPEGFRATLIARSGERVPGTSHLFHDNPDGAATFPAPDGGWIYVSNSEGTPGGAGMIRFDGRGEVVASREILASTAYNCSGGATPWHTWLSCEEVPYGCVWECDPLGRRAAVRRPALGLFKHEAVAVDPVTRRLYMTEDIPDGRLYRFTPARWRDLRAGLLEVATVHRGGRVTWTRVPDPLARRKETRFQVEGTTSFLRAEGIYRIGRTVYIGTTENSQIHAYDLDGDRIEVVYDGFELRDPPLIALDQMTGSPAGELFVAEDNGRPAQAISTLDPPRAVHRFLTVSGPIHKGSELTGVAFTPRGDRLLFASQRAYGNGAVYEVRGPFRRRL